MFSCTGIVAALGGLATSAAWVVGVAAFTVGVAAFTVGVAALKYGVATRPPVSTPLSMRNRRRASPACDKAASCDSLTAGCCCSRRGVGSDRLMREPHERNCDTGAQAGREQASFPHEKR